MTYILFAPPSTVKRGDIVWTYGRDSGGPNQTESVRQQNQEFILYCEKHGLLLNRRFNDEAESGGSTKKREAFNTIMELCDDQAIKPRCLLIWNFARFARNEDDAEFFFLSLKRQGVIVHSLTDYIPEDENLEKLSRFHINFANALFRKQNSDAVKRGLRDLIHMGKGYAPGTPPRGIKGEPVEIGKRRDGKPHIVSQWVPDPVLHDYVRLAFEMLNDKKSLKEITQATEGKLYTNKNSWATFFKNKSYIGYYGDTPDHHEMLIPEELFYSVQTRLKTRNTERTVNHPRRVHSPTLFGGFSYCAECGNMMVTGYSSKKHPWNFYLCGKKNRQGADSCPSKRIGAKVAEEKIMTFVFEKILTSEYLSEVIAEAKDKFTSTADIEKQITATRRNIENLNLAIQRTLNAVEKTGSTAAQERLAQREAEYNLARAELKRLTAQLSAVQIEITPEAMEIILTAWREQYKQVNTDGNINAKKAWIMQFGDCSKFGKERVRGNKRGSRGGLKGDQAIRLLKFNPRNK
jgi:DNA invertase Pin-like site-specific DNA recombinase